MSPLRDSRLARSLPAPAKSAIKRVVAVAERPRWGNLRRMTPFSQRYGFDRGTPVDRHYITRFLGRHEDDVRGDVLEVRDALYTRQFGGSAVTASEILDVDPRNEEATIVADLCEPGSLPEGRFDCFVITQTLQLMPDLDAALRNAWGTLAPGGVLLATVPTVSRIDRTLAAIDLMRFTPAGLENALERSCPDAAELDVTGYGNLVAAIAFLTGLAAEELREDELDQQDPHFPILACGRLVKPGR
jgi:SAM-dependent methyltransferase